MAQEKREVSLKRSDGMWAGQSDQSYFAPTEGAFEKLINCYVSQDGTEIRRMPPLTLWVDPMLTQGPIGISVMQDGPRTSVRFRQEHRLFDSAGAFSGQRVYVLGNSSIPDGWYPITRFSDDEAIIDVFTTTPSVSGSFLLERAIEPHAMRMVDNKLVILAESLTTYVSPVVGNRQKYHLATWVQDKPIDYRMTTGLFQYWSSPLNEPDIQTGINAAIPASVASSATIIIAQHGYASTSERFKVTVAGFASRGVPDGTYTAKVQTPYESFVIPQASGSSGTITFGGPVGYPFQAYNRPIRRRMQVDVADGKLLIAAPGEGVCFQAYVGYTELDLLTLRRRTNLLGLPKAIMQIPEPFNNGGTGNLAAGVYWVACGYHNTRTDEFGLISEPIQVTVTSPNNAVRVYLHTPRAALREVIGASIIIWMSDVNSGQGTMRQVLETEVAASHVSYNYPVEVNSLANISVRMPIIENLPAGATSVRTVKGTTFFCSQLSSNLTSIAAAERTFAAIDFVARDQIVISPTIDPAVGITALSGGMAADYQFPSSIGGYNILMNGLPIFTLDRVLNAIYDIHAGVNNGQNHVWSITTQHDLKNTVPYVTRDSIISIPRGLVWFSEQGFPGVSPSTNRIPVDRLEGFDVIALGRMDDTLIICSDKETYSLTWDRSPLGVNPRMMSTEYGCIAPSSMTQFDGGLAWLSDRGPVLMTSGGFQWISSSISSTWNSYKRDSRGWMPHAFAAHDPTRKIILFFLRKDRNSSAYAMAVGDDKKSKVPCDEVLVYSYAANAWSVWELKPEHECVDATNVLCYDGIRRLGILTGAKLVYLFDETLRDTLELVDVRIETKSSLWSSTATPLERATKVGAVNIRMDTAQLYPDMPGTSYTIRATAFDDLRKETFIADVEQATQNRTRLSFGAVRAQESKISIRFLGVGPLRIKDITLEVSPGG